MTKHEKLINDIAIALGLDPDTDWRFLEVQILNTVKHHRKKADLLEKVENAIKLLVNGR